MDGQHRAKNWLAFLTNAALQLHPLGLFRKLLSCQLGMKLDGLVPSQWSEHSSTSSSSVNWLRCSNARSFSQVATYKSLWMVFSVNLERRSRRKRNHLRTATENAYRLLGGAEAACRQSQRLAVIDRRCAPAETLKMATAYYYGELIALRVHQSLY